MPDAKADKPPAQPAAAGKLTTRERVMLSLMMCPGQGQRGGTDRS